MIRRMMTTTGGWEMLLLRLAAGIVILPHGLQKLFGIWGGAGLTGIMNFFTTVIHLPAPIGYLVILTEVVGGVCLLLGVFTRIAAFAIACEMVGAVLLWHLPNGFFMNWEAKMQAGMEGFEFHILFVAMLITLVSRGAGTASADAAIAAVGPRRSA